MTRSELIKRLYAYTIEHKRIHGYRTYESILIEAALYELTHSVVRKENGYVHKK